MHKLFFHMDDFGRSVNVSKKIIKCVKFGYINSVSVMMGFTSKSLHKKILKTRAKTKLHINLTENSQSYLKAKIKLKNLSFFDILFANKSLKKILKKSIDLQIQSYREIYGSKKIGIDGHEHVHIIPWVHNYLTSLTNIKIKEIRYPNEKINIYGYKNLFKKQFYRNFVALLLVKFLIIFLKKKKKSPIFFGLLYSGIYNHKILNENFKRINRKRETELLIHGGYTNKSERRHFETNFFKSYTSQSIKNQYKLAFKKFT